MKSWSIPWVTGHKYKIHWENGIDFVNMKVEVSPRWEVADQPIFFVHNFTDVREEFNVTT